MTDFSNLTSNGVPVGGTLGPFGIGCGNIKYMVTAVSSNKYYDFLRDRGLGADIFLTLATAYAATIGDENDVIAVTPGKYTATASLAWANDRTHLVGLGGPLARGGMDTSSEVWIDCTTVAIESVIDMQSNNCEMYGVHLRNVAADAGNLCALKVSTGVNFYAEDCHFNGQGAATQVGTAGACALWLYTASGGKPWGARFNRCKIGDAGELVRTAGPVIYLSGGAAGTAKYLEFIDCVVEGWCETAAIPAVEFAANYCIDRYILFKDTLFFNYYVNNADKLNEVFKNSCGTTFSCILQGSTMMVGYTAWNTTGLNYFFGSAATPSATGGTGTALT